MCLRMGNVDPVGPRVEEWSQEKEVVVSRRGCFGDGGGRDLVQYVTTRLQSSVSRLSRLSMDVQKGWRERQSE